MTNNYIGNATVSEGLRSGLALYILVGSFLSVNFSTAYLVLSWYVKISLDKQISFLKEFYQPAAVPVSLAITGVVMLVTSLLGIKAAIGGRFDEDEVQEMSELKSVATFFMIFWIAASVVAIVTCAASMVCFIEIYQLESALGKGIKEAMLKYRTDGPLKAEVDHLQMDYSCCGVASYKDWFNISWVDLQYLDTNDKEIKKKVKGGFYYSGDVPFSCCRLKISRPCVDSRILTPSYHSKYNPQTDNTLNVVGCREAIVQFLGHYIFKSIGLYVIACLLIWVAMIVAGRYLHTSILSLSTGGASVGWLIGIEMKGKSESKSKKGVEEEESGSELTEVVTEEEETEEDEEDEEGEEEEK